MSEREPRELEGFVVCMLHVINYVLTHPMAVTTVLTWGGRGGEDVSLILNKASRTLPHMIL